MSFEIWFMVFSGRGIVWSGGCGFRGWKFRDGYF